MKASQCTASNKRTHTRAHRLGYLWICALCAHCADDVIRCAVNLYAQKSQCHRFYPLLPSGTKFLVFFLSISIEPDYQFS